MTPIKDNNQSRSTVQRWRSYVTPWASKNPLRMEGRGKAPPHVNVEHPTIIGNPVDIGSRGEAPALKSCCNHTIQTLQTTRKFEEFITTQLELN